MKNRAFAKATRRQPTRTFRRARRYSQRSVGAKTGAALPEQANRAPGQLLKLRLYPRGLNRRLTNQKRLISRILLRGKLGPMTNAATEIGAFLGLLARTVKNVKTVKTRTVSSKNKNPRASRGRS